MARVIDLVDKNIKLIKIFVKAGKMPLSIMTDYDIYKFYKTINYEKAQMKKYDIVAKNFKVSAKTVQRAVSEMEKNVTN